MFIATCKNCELKKEQQQLHPAWKILKSSRYVYCCAKIQVHQREPNPQSQYHHPHAVTTTPLVADCHAVEDDDNAKKVRIISSVRRKSRIMAGTEECTRHWDLPSSQQQLKRGKQSGHDMIHSFENLMECLTWLKVN